MTSQTRIAANRRNGRNSRGPRTAAGKSRASVNALRHGLAALTHDPALSSDIARVSRAICADDENPLLREHAMMIAENAIMLVRVRAARVAAIERGRHPGKPIELHDEIAAMQQALPTLERLARYERRAWTARDRAIHNFVAIRSGRHSTNS
jgi:hypothetical protein